MFWQKFDFLTIFNVQHPSFLYTVSLKIFSLYFTQNFNLMVAYLKQKIKIHFFFIKDVLSNFLVRTRQYILFPFKLKKPTSKVAQKYCPELPKLGEFMFQIVAFALYKTGA